jgi:hypothetical protein
MTSPSTPDPETLGKIAAQLDPKLARDDPAKAIEQARNLFLAANPELAKRAAEQAEEIQLQEESECHDRLFPRGELISVAEAFEALPGHYKTEQGFTDALRKENLTIMVQEVDWARWRKASPGEQDKSATLVEVTSLKAARELFRRQRAVKTLLIATGNPRPTKKTKKMLRKKRSKSGTKPSKSGKKPSKSGSR